MPSGLIDPFLLLKEVLFVGGPLVVNLKAMFLLFLVL
jgi:hypothetical protein